MHDAVGRPRPVPARQLETLASVYDAMPVGMAVWSVDGRARPGQPRVLRPDARRSPTSCRSALRLVRRSRSRPTTVRDQLAELLVGQRNFVECEFGCRRPDGVDHWVTNMLTAVYGPSGRPDYLRLPGLRLLEPPHPRGPGLPAGERDAGAAVADRPRRQPPHRQPHHASSSSASHPTRRTCGPALLERMHPDDLAEVGDGIRADHRRPGAVRVHRPGDAGRRPVPLAAPPRPALLRRGRRVRGLRRRQPRRDRVRGAAPRARRRCASCSQR